uniref:Uncharacterized protein n=1 Tax=Pyxicephalus adspersus TaxID=30357 RepID=A0AAV3AH85_PYXAD|nr:TPA: hypothetical protein GDO54_010625 [Pyxicephalus adspersus]
MAAARRQAIIFRVLSRLYPEPISSDASVQQPNAKIENVTQLQEIGKTNAEDAQLPAYSKGLDFQNSDNGQIECNRLDDPELSLENSTVPAHNEKELTHHQKIYTASPPPDDYVPGPQDADGSSSTENSDFHEDIEENQPMKRQRRHRWKHKQNVTAHSSTDSRYNLNPTKHQSLKPEGVFINKNKKRKLQRKRQKERLKSAGLWPKTGKLANQPENGMVDSLEQCIAQSEEQQKKTEDLLDFLQATQEIYFTERY